MPLISTAWPRGPSLKHLYQALFIELPGFLMPDLFERFSMDFRFRDLTDLPVLAPVFWLVSVAAVLSVVGP